ncbi:protein of unknown function [Cardinium endosymbiont cEper1 of Encarsia pergandiella]|nr:protein of unknown function [Cardinium endosymbiont cEper1 of Encarsia pergandiella]
MNHLSKINHIKNNTINSYTLDITKTIKKKVIDFLSIILPYLLLRQTLNQKISF